jgi:hypothetical protein
MSSYGSYHIWNSNVGVARNQKRLEQKVAKFAKRENEVPFAAHAKAWQASRLPRFAGAFCSNLLVSYCCS